MAPDGWAETCNWEIWLKIYFNNCPIKVVLDYIYIFIFLGVWQMNHTGYLQEVALIWMPTSLLAIQNGIMKRYTACTNLLWWYNWSRNRLGWKSWETNDLIVTRRFKVKSKTRTVERLRTFSFVNTGKSCTKGGLTMDANKFLPEGHKGMKH